MIVAAGNPPEYNSAARELDMVTLDRVKTIEVEADLEIWRVYARQQGAHPAVMTYLHLYPDHFYRIRDTDRGQLFVTARGWEDLSLMLRVYEEDGIRVDGLDAAVGERHCQHVAPGAEACREEGQERAAREIVVGEEEGVGEVGPRAIASGAGVERELHEAILRDGAVLLGPEDQLLELRASRPQRGRIQKIALADGHFDEVARPAFAQPRDDGRKRAGEIESDEARATRHTGSGQADLNERSARV